MKENHVLGNLTTGIQHMPTAHTQGFRHLTGLQLTTGTTHDLGHIDIDCLSRDFKSLLLIVNQFFC